MRPRLRAGSPSNQHHTKDTDTLSAAMDSSTSFDGPEFDFLSYLDTSKFDLPIGTSPQDDQHQQLMSGLLLGQGVGQGQGGNAKAQYSSTGTSSTLDSGAAAVLAALSPSSSSASASSASGGSPLFGNLSYSSNSNSNSNGNNSGTGLAFSTKFAGFNGSGFGGNAYQSSLAAAGSTSGNSSHTDAGSSSGGSPPFDASMYGQQQQRQSARTMPDQKLSGDFSFANHVRTRFSLVSPTHIASLTSSLHHPAITSERALAAGLHAAGAGGPVSSEQQRHLRCCNSAVPPLVSAQ